MDGTDGTAQRPETLGERLAVLAEYLRLRHAVGFAWAPGFAAVLERLDAFDDAWAGRFERYEGWEDLASTRNVPDRSSGRAPIVRRACGGGNGGCRGPFGRRCGHRFRRRSGAAETAGRCSRPAP